MTTARKRGAAGRERTSKQDAARADVLDGWPGPDDPQPPEVVCGTFGAESCDEPALPSETPLLTSARGQPPLDWALDVVIAKAEKLRDAGVVRVQVGGVQFDLQPKFHVPAAAKGDHPGDDEPNPLHSGVTYVSGRVPGLRPMKELFDVEDP